MHNSAARRTRNYTLGLTLNLLYVAHATPGQAAELISARSADSFVDSIGFNTHFTYTNTPYVQDYSEVVRPRLQELGIRHIRDGVVPERMDYYERLKDLGSIGIRSTLISGTDIDPQQTVAIAKQLGSAQAAVEGPNEYDNNRDNRDPAYWVPTVRNYTQQLHNAFKSDSATANIPILGPSFVGGEASELVGDLSPWVDYGNFHPYNYPDHPGSGGHLNNEITRRSQPFKGKPMIATEAGYHTGGPDSDRPISETAQGKYLPRLFLEHFNRGIERTFAYELLDQWSKPNDREANFGILRNDGSPKPAFNAIKNLIQLLSDPGDEFALQSLDYVLGGDTTDISQTLLQKRNGNFYLILWQEVASYTPFSREPQVGTDLLVQDKLVTLTLNSLIGQAIAYEPFSSSNPITAYKNPQEINLSVGDHPLVLELIPGWIKDIVSKPVQSPVPTPDVPTDPQGATEIPAPALLPGLIGLSWRIMRKRGSSDEILAENSVSNVAFG
ncbi:PTPA-CTERM sorting domain-containing protein [Leptolyngbya sp. FACHB-261]|uniref:PTPA-CTERM sorting domain-containing protein n=1 Tax=Leptolyngbya sp. FACHB-261 TaxID=2692806 RepID=UPI0016887F21|nr:PTPA-CTERM sorting domain-containing protein [Leptolyngbya sp. FACHB-261]MBD2103741.1 PTPA-CTERM sorting domain-containing protein [Leptolyngbya sp. FACHB-261]